MAKIQHNTKAILISLVCPQLEGHKTKEDTLYSLDELRELLHTLEVKTGKQYIQKRNRPDPGTLVGSGKIKEIAAYAKEEEASLLAFDCELTASQSRNISKITQLPVTDRVHIILEIFSQRAQTRQAKIQIEIARLQYFLPRLTGLWTHLGRQRGAGVKSGEGEKQIELDRRIISSRINSLEKEIQIIARSKAQQKKKRQNQVLTVTLIGHTNAGKSSLANRLCSASLTEKDQLFSTLDTTVRTLNPDGRPPIVLTDTVGFISNLPNTLINGFKTTLESALEADLLVLVCDAHHPHWENHLKVTRQVLKELGECHRPCLLVFNKRDLLTPEHIKNIYNKYPHNLMVSSFYQRDMKKLRQHIMEQLLKNQNHYKLFIPYEAGQAHSAVLGQCNIIKTIHRPKGIYYHIRTPHFLFHQLKLSDFICKRIS